MVTVRTLENPVLAREYAKISQMSDLCLVDVGVSYGIAPYWRSFGERLSALGIDPLVNEIERLRRIEQSEKVRYLAKFLSSSSYEGEPKKPDFEYPEGTEAWFRRTSTKWSYEILDLDYKQQCFNDGQPLIYASQTATLDSVLESENLKPDFIKIDTDGHDFEVLKGCDTALENCLGIAIEAQLHAEPGDQASVLGNIDRYLRAKGFAIFDLDLHRYTRRALPGRFCHEIPAFTREGQIRLSDAVYLRDPTDAACLLTSQFEWDAERLIKLVCLLELFGQADSAADILITYRDKIEPSIDVEKWLDLLAPKGRYQDFVKAFEANPKSHIELGPTAPSEFELFKTKLRLQDSLAEKSSEVDLLRQKLAESEKTVADYESVVAQKSKQIETLNEQLEQSKATVHALLNSKSWALTAPVRWLGTKLGI